MQERRSFFQHHIGGKEVIFSIDSTFDGEGYQFQKSWLSENMKNYPKDLKVISFESENEYLEDSLKSGNSIVIRESNEICIHPGSSQQLEYGLAKNGCP